MDQQPAAKKHPIQRAAIRALKVTLPPVSHRVHGTYAGKTRHLFFDTLLALVMLFAAGLVIAALTNPALFFGPSLSLRLSPAAAFIADETTTVIAVVENAGAASVDRATLELTLPDGVTVRESSRAGTAAALWEFTDLKPGDEQTLELVLGPAGAPGTTSAVTATLRSDHRGRTVTRTATAQWTVPDAALDVALELPETLEHDKTASGTVTVRNVGTTSLGGGHLLANVRLTLPPELVAVSADPAAVSDGTARVWQITDLAAGATQQFRIVVKAATAERRVGTVTATGTTLLAPSRTLVERTATRTVTVTPPPSAHDITTEPQPSAPLVLAAEARYWSAAGVQFGFGPLPPRVGETTGYRVFWTVRAGTTLTGAAITATLPDAARWNGHETVTHGEGIVYDSGSRTIGWTIGDLAPNDNTVSASFEVTITPTASDIGNALTLLNATTARASDGTALTVSAPAVDTELSDPGGKGKGKVVK